MPAPGSAVDSARDPNTSGCGTAPANEECEERHLALQRS